MNSRAQFLTWWGLPILCVGLGAVAATYAGDGAGSGSQAPKLMHLGLIGVYFVAVGFLAVIFRIRQNQVALEDRKRFEKPVEAALIAMCAPILAAGLWVFATGFMADFGPSQTIRGKLQAVDQVGAFGRSYAIDLDTTAHPLVLECRVRRNCGSPTPLLRLKSGAPAEVEILNRRVLGMSLDGRPVVDPARQRFWRLIFGGAALALMVVYTAAFIGVSIQLLLMDDDEAEPLDSDGAAASFQ
ncbi:hypothetical protein [Phenylobacterium sp.]|uniref:hypothetical protein n=1 Tax=Phenylobacterium sp. TaxID=1871053 RepID=UPI002736E69B|nr:hypothetical protein [Phenylobacterium sp.]MDP3853013.1 hypothetical protein [Phenylobacterium sp.]